MPTAETTTPRPAARPLSAAEKRKIVQLYTRKQKPLSIRAIAVELGRSFGAVHRALDEAQVERRPKGTRAAKTSK